MWLYYNFIFASANFSASSRLVVNSSSSSSLIIIIFLRSSAFSTIWCRTEACTDLMRLWLCGRLICRMCAHDWRAMDGLIECLSSASLFFPTPIIKLFKSIEDTAFIVRTNFEANHQNYRLVFYRIWTLNNRVKYVCWFFIWKLHSTSKVANPYWAKIPFWKLASKRSIYVRRTKYMQYRVYYAQN